VPHASRGSLPSFLPADFILGVIVMRNSSQSSAPRTASSATSPFRIEPAVAEDRARCSLRPLTDAARGQVAGDPVALAAFGAQFGVCSGRRCDFCVRAKCDDSSPLRIEPGDRVSVETRGGQIVEVECFERNSAGMRTGMVKVFTRFSRRLLLPLSAITLHRKMSQTA
jgi:hypothetical protein